MGSINRIDQAVLLLRDRLEKLGGRQPSAGAGSIATGKKFEHDPLAAVRQLVSQGRLQPRELRRALVRALLASSLGDKAGDTLEFQVIADQVTDILEESEVGQALLVQALNEIG